MLDSPLSQFLIRPCSLSDTGPLDFEAVDVGFSVLLGFQFDLLHRSRIPLRDYWGCIFIHISQKDNLHPFWWDQLYWWLNLQYQALEPALNTVSRWNNLFYDILMLLFQLVSKTVPFTLYSPSNPKLQGRSYWYHSLKDTRL